MNKFLRIVLLSLLVSSTASAQFTFTAGDNILELSGLIGVYYNYRFLKPAETSYKKDRFGLRDMKLDLEGKKGNKWEYELKVDFADLATNSAAGGIVDPENPGLECAYIMYKGLPVTIELGYDKLPYSQGSIDDIYSIPFWSRGILTDGSLFSRRDLGLTLSRTLWKQRINIYGGIYTGMGENIFANQGDNDDSGAPEYIGRIDIAYPSRFRYKEIDEVGVPIPMFRVGANVRYANKTQPTGATLPVNAAGDYNLRLVAGEKFVYGFDANFQYRNFSAQFETQMLSLRPSLQTDPLFAGTALATNNKVVKAGGYLLQGNYCLKAARSVLSVQYQDVNLNDLVYGSEEWLSLAYGFMINSFKNVIKIQYYKPLTEDTKSDPLKYTAQLRIGWQYHF
ncbi:MAG: hypothetical protein BGO69_00065 [Bacteroidetes bacterium 46-16]|nr:MAG: hypothetical protein BGO69_00065 [Bacteroidetes bacterium 46-16]